MHVALIMSVSTASSQLLETMTKIFCDSLNIRFKESQISWTESESAGGKLIPDQLNRLGHHCCKYNKQWFYYEGLRTCVLCLWRWVLSQRSVHLKICADGGTLLKGVLCVNLLSLIWNRTQVIHCLSTPAGCSLYCIATVTRFTGHISYTVLFVRTGWPSWRREGNWAFFRGAGLFGVEQSVWKKNNGWK